MPCDIIIPVFNQKDYTQGCLESIKKNTSQGDYRIIIVDDKSSDPDAVKFLGAIKDENVKVIRNETNLGWVGSVNRGIKESTAQYLCIMNNDTLVTDGWLAEMVAIAEKSPDIGLVNPEWEKPDNISADDYARRRKKFSGDFIETDWVRGFCFLVKRKLIDKIGGLDEAYSPGYYDDCDYSVRAIGAGFRPVRAKASYVYHYRNGTHASTLKKEGMNSLLAKHKKLFYERWGEPLRIAFIFNKPVKDKKGIEGLFLKLARGQHHLYIRATQKNAPFIEHTNIRINLLPNFFFNLSVFFNVFTNLRRSIHKRYDIIFMEDKRLLNLFSLSGLTRKTHIFLTDFNDAAACDGLVKHIDKVKANQKK